MKCLEKLVLIYHLLLIICTLIYFIYHKVDNRALSLYVFRTFKYRQSFLSVLVKVLLMFSYAKIITQLVLLVLYFLGAK